MDGTRLIITKPIIVASQETTGKLEIWSTLYGDSAVVLAFVVYPKRSLSVSKGDSILVTLDNDTKVCLTIHQDAVAMGNEIMKLTILSMLNPENRRMLESHLVKGLIISTSQGELLFNTKKKKQANAVAYLIGCVKEYLVENKM